MTFTPSFNPSPKPAPKVKEKKPAKARTPIKSAGPIKPKPRSKSEYARIYGSRERVKWVKAQSCIVCGSTPCDNAHIENEGKGRKAHYTKIVPLCSTLMWDDEPGCHDELHELGRETFELLNSVDLDAFAAETEALWTAFQKTRGAMQ